MSISLWMHCDIEINKNCGLIKLDGTVPPYECYLSRTKFNIRDIPSRMGVRYCEIYLIAEC